MEERKMDKVTRYYGKIKTAKGEHEFIFSLRALVKFLKTGDFIKVIILKKRPKATQE